MDRLAKVARLILHGSHQHFHNSRKHQSQVIKRPVNWSGITNTYISPPMLASEYRHLKHVLGTGEIRQLGIFLDGLYRQRDASPL
jgi:hypothetical protein